MLIYIYKNNQQLGPFEKEQVFKMLENGQLSPNDSAVRQGENEWRKLSEIFQNAGHKAFVNVAAVPNSQPVNAAPKKSRRGLLLGCGGFMLIAVLASTILGFIAFRNMNPADSTENLPDKVKDFKLNNRYPPKGNIWGTETTFVGLYSNDSKTQTVLYLITIFADENTAKEAFRTELYKSCQTGEKPMYFSFVKSGAEKSQAATCAVPLYVQKDNKLIALGGSGATVDAFIEFAENLPFNDGTTMIKKTDK